MADTLRDGIRDLANAQATWINTLASARGFFRNAQPPTPTDDEEDVDSDGDEEIEEEAPTTWIDNIKPLVDTAATSATNAIMDWSMRAGSKLSSLLKPNAAAAPASIDAEVGARVREWHRSQTIDSQPDGSVRISFSCSNLAPIVSWVLEWGPHARAIAPAELVDAVVSELDAARALYRSRTTSAPR